MRLCLTTELRPTDAAWASPPGFLRNIRSVAAGELRDALRSRWFLLDSAAFTLMGLAVSWVSASAAGSSGMAGFGRTTAGLTNLVTLLVPLMALTAGALSISGDRERGMLAYLLAQPITRAELLLGKFFGLGMALVAAITLGLGVCAATLALRGGNADPSTILRLAGLSVVLALVMLSLGMCVSVFVRRTSVATATAVFLWLMLVFGTDLGLMAGTIALRVKIQTLFIACMANPMQVFKMWSLHASDVPLDVLGPVGLYAIDHHAGWMTRLFSLAMGIWVVLPLSVALFVFSRRDAT